MPELDFDLIPDSALMPAGVYDCTISNVATDERTKNGDEMWILTLTVSKGPYLARSIFDRLVFSERALPRIKLICSRLGIPVKGKFNLEPRHLRGKDVQVVVEIDERTFDGKLLKSNKVTFDGYNPDGANGRTPPGPIAEADDIPF